jgi:hypothetical protein
MATEWFYTTNKQQMGPVSWKELLELVEVGILKPHDLVWTEGMDDWVKAINQKGLFADTSAEEGVSAGKKSAYSQAKPPPGRRTRRADDDEEEDEEDDREAKRKARKREEARAKTSVGIKVGLILAGVVCVLLVMACGGSVLLWLSLRGGGGDGPRRETYTIVNLNQNGQNIRHFNFKQGQRVVVTATNQLSRPDTDVDLLIFQGNDANPFAFDKDLPQRNRNCRVEFVAPANDSYRVIVVNLGPGMANRCDVAIDVR